MERMNCMVATENAASHRIASSRFSGLCRACIDVELTRYRDDPMIAPQCCRASQYLWAARFSLNTNKNDSDVFSTIPKKNSHVSLVSKDSCKTTSETTVHTTALRVRTDQGSMILSNARACRHGDVSHQRETTLTRIYTHLNCGQCLYPSIGTLCRHDLCLSILFENIMSRLLGGHHGSY